MARRRNIPAERPVITHEGWQKARQLLSFLKPYKWYFFVGLFFLSLGSSVFMVFPAAAGELIDIATNRSDSGWTLEDVGLGLLAILIIQAISSYFRVLLFAHVSEKGMADIRKALYDKLITQSTSFFDQNRVGELTSRSTADVQQLQDVISITSAELIRQLIILFVGLSYLAYMAPQLLLVMLSTFPVVILIALFFGRYIRKLSRNRQDKLAYTSTIIEETLQAISVVKAFTNEWFERKRYAASVEEVVHISLRFAQIRGLFIVFIITALFGAMFFVLWWGATLVQSGDMAPGELVTFITLTAIIGGAVASLGDFYTQILRAVGASERIMELLNSPTEFDVNTRFESSTINGDIHFDRVSFHYPSRPELCILDDISMHFKSGQKIALVGASGGGKSTIVLDFALLRAYLWFNIDRRQRHNAVSSTTPAAKYWHCTSRSNFIWGVDTRKHCLRKAFCYRSRNYRSGAPIQLLGIRSVFSGWTRYNSRRTGGSAFGRTTTTHRYCKSNSQKPQYFVVRRGYISLRCRI
jgi:ABC-type multidrug transport system fused ATPase/permease subunit